jgi:flavin reductase (DIM6/NTAB) family NADH-FMN oxidoreductase RutF
MLLDPLEMQPREVYSTLIRAISPRPIAWVSTISRDGVPNLAPFSFFNGVSSSPPSVVFSPVNHPDGRKKDTVVNIESNRQFVINMVPFSLAEQMSQTSAEYAHGVSEFESAGVTSVASQRVAPPRVAQAPIQVECELIQIVTVGEGPLSANLVIGKILLMHVDDEVCTDGKIDPQKADLIGRMGGADYCRTTDRFTVPRPKL